MTPSLVIASLRQQAWQSRFGGSQQFCHCEASQRPKQSLFAFPNTPWVSKIAASPKMRAPRNDVWEAGSHWDTEIATSGQKTPFLAMTWGKDTPCGDCFVGAKGAPPRNDVEGGIKPLLKTCERSHLHEKSFSQKVQMPHTKNLIHNLFSHIRKKFQEL